MGVFKLIVPAIVAALVGLYLLFTAPYVKDASYFMTAPDVGMVVLTVVNPTPFPACITGVEVLKPGGVKAELHETIFNGSIAAMRPVSEVCVNPFSSLRFAHGGYHVMIMGNATGTLEIALIFKDGRRAVFTATPSRAEFHIH